MVVRRGLVMRSVAAAVVVASLGSMPGRASGAAAARLHPDSAVAVGAREPRPLALLAGRPGEETTRLYLVGTEETGTGSLALGRAVATLEHPPWATLRAATQGRAVLVVVDATTGGDLSFAAELVRLVPGGEVTRLAGGVVHASRPLPLAGGREVLVSRGEAGTGFDDGARADRLTIDAIDVVTGATRTILEDSGSALFLAGVTDEEVLVYRVSTEGLASLVAARLDSGSTRVLLASLPPFARDFSLDARRHRLVFENRDEEQPSRFVVESVDLVTGELRRLHADRSGRLAPSVWPDGSVLLNLPRQLLPYGLPAGSIRIEATDLQQAGLAVMSSNEGRMPVAWRIDAAVDHARRVEVPPGLRPTIAGYLSAAAVAP